MGSRKRLMGSSPTENSVFHWGLVFSIITNSVSIDIREIIDWGHDRSTAISALGVWWEFMIFFVFKMSIDVVSITHKGITSIVKNWIEEITIKGVDALIRGTYHKM